MGASRSDEASGSTGGWGYHSHESSSSAGVIELRLISVELAELIGCDLRGNGANILPYLVLKIAVRGEYQFTGAGLGLQVNDQHRVLDLVMLTSPLGELMNPDLSREPILHTSAISDLTGRNQSYR